MRTRKNIFFCDLEQKVKPVFVAVLVDIVLGAGVLGKVSPRTRRPHAGTAAYFVKRIVLFSALCRLCYLTVFEGGVQSGIDAHHHLALLHVEGVDDVALGYP